MGLVRLGSKGLEVGRVQQALIEAGYDVPRVERSALLFGPGTKNAVRAFQASHLGPTGKPLGEDGVVGDETWHALQHPGLTARAGLLTADGWRYAPEEIPEALRSVVALAVNEIGTREQPDGSNDGPRVRAYTAPDHIGDPWCALFTSWCFEHGLPQGSPFGRIAAVWKLFEWGEANKRILAGGDEVLPGDVFVTLRGARDSANRRGHAGIICAKTDKAHFATVEGNASNAVRGLVRQRWNVSAVLRPVP